ncbi:MAG: DUF1206 domain-containing protein [Actinomycetota bacterium]|nr:DUF1206 domain-containing protein [Actinomycetota bacterium]
MDTNDVRSAAVRANDHPALENAARLGYATNGVVHLLIGWLAIQVALQNGQESADQSGALQSLADNPVGRIILWLAVIGFVGLAVWQLSEVVVGRGETSDRVKAGAKAVLYAVLAVSAFTYAKGSSSSSSTQQSVDFTSTLMGQPAGRWLVGAVGVAIIAIGGYHVYKGYKKTFLEDLERHPGQWAVNAGRFGYIAKGVALAVVGLLFVLASLHSSADESTGLDGALRTLKDAPFGVVALVVVALGFVSFAVYSFARARYAKV